MTGPFLVRADECDAYGHCNNAVLLAIGLVDLPRPRPGDRILATYAAPAFAGEAIMVSGDGNRRELHTGGRIAEVELLPGEAGAPEPADGITIERHVRWRDVDATGTAPVAALASLAEDAGIAVVAAHGWPMERCSGSGFGMVLHRTEIDLHGTARCGDVVTIATWATDAARSTATRHYRIEGPEGPVASFRGRYVWVDLATSRPIRIPEPFLDDLAANFRP